MRLAWLDNAKMVAMICVIIGHIGPLLINGWPFQIGSLIVSFNMPLFVMLAGITGLSGIARVHDYKTLLEYLDKVLWRMVVPAVALSAINQAWLGLILARKLWVVFAIITLLLWLLKRYSSSGVITSKWVKMLCAIMKDIFVVFLLVSSTWLNMFWFLTMLLKLQVFSACAIMVLCLIHISQKIQILLLACGIWIISYLMFDSWTFEMSIYFAIGLLLKQCGFVDRVLNMPYWLSAIFTVIGISICYIWTGGYGFYSHTIDSLVQDGNVYIYILRVIAAICLSIAIIRWVFGLSGVYNWFSHAGSRSMAFYIIHVLILETWIYPYLHLSVSLIEGIISVLVLASITYGIILLCERTKITRGLVLGDWK